MPRKERSILKKFLSILLMLLVTFALASCKSDDIKNPLADQTAEEFSTVDLAGVSVTNDVFSQAEITMINLWGTFCGPCIREMPDINRVYNEYRDKGVNVIGIVGDVVTGIKADEVIISDETVGTAIEMIDELGVEYTNIIPDKALTEQFLLSFDYVPVTLFVNDEGKILNTFIPGSTDYENFRNILDDILAGKRK